jgi:excisionase family DNA binding protein
MDEKIAELMTLVIAPKDAAKRYGVSESLVYKLIAEGKLTPYRLNRRGYMIPLEQFESAEVQASFARAHKKQAHKKGAT